MRSLTDKTMYLRAFLISAVFLCLSHSAYSYDGTSGNYQKIIPVDSEIYALIENLSLEEGHSLLSGVKPWSESEVNTVLRQLKNEELSAAGKAALARIRTILEKSSIYTEDSFAADVSVSVGLEAYLHTSDDESRWEYGFEERQPVFSLQVETWFNEGFYAVLAPDIQESRFLIDYADADGNYIGNLSNIPSEFGDINYHFPNRGFFSTGGENWNLQLGRDQLEYGSGQTGKLMLSSYPDYYDFFKLKGFVDNFAFTWTYINLESWSDSDANTRFISDHAMEVRLFDLMTLYVNESALFYGEATELQFISPLIIYHNLYDHSFSTGFGSNIYMTVGFNIVPLKGLSLYGEYLLDELQTWVEIAEYGEGVASTPNAEAYMLGLKGSVPLGPGYLTGFFEHINTSPWCYLLAPAGGSIAWTHRETTDVYNARRQVIKPLGYEYGPDTLAFSGKVGYVMPGVFDAAVTADYIMKGENTITTPWTDEAGAAQMTTPSGTPEKKLVIGLSGTYEIFSFFSAGLDLALVDIRNFNHVSDAAFFDFQTAASIVFKL